LGNPYFNFKKFGIWQEKSAMKVCTDSCIFGAFVSQAIHAQHKNHENLQVLDVGTGTGLLSLMLSQKNDNLNITAIEPDLDSFLECKLNFEKSNWADRLIPIQQNLETFAPLKSNAFDIIICNPPFFINHLPSPSESRNKALHTSKHEWENWLVQLTQLVSENGKLWILISGESLEFSLSITEKLGFCSETQIDLHQKNKQNWRHILCFSKNKTKIPTRFEANIYEQNGELSGILKLWLSAFYLKL